MISSAILLSIALLVTCSLAEDCGGPIMASTKLPDQCPLINYVVNWNLTDFSGSYYIQFSSTDYTLIGCDGTCMTETAELTPEGNLDIGVYCKHQSNCQKLIGGGIFVPDSEFQGRLNGPNDTQAFVLGYGETFYIFYACIPGCPRTDLLVVKTRDATVDSQTTQKVIKILAENGFDIAKISNIVNYDTCPPL